MSRCEVIVVRAFCRNCLFIALLLLGALAAWAEPPCLFGLNGNDLRLPPGEYYPGPYYSRQYLQEFPLQPNQRPVYFRMIPFEHYGEYRLGEGAPGLTTGNVQSNWFPYRYHYGFEPHVHRIIPYNECDYLRRIERVPVPVPAP